MTIKVTIEVPDAKIGKLLTKLNGYKALCQHIPEETHVNVPKGAVRHNRAESILTMTGKRPNANSKLAKALEIFEKQEKSRGIGNVTVADFRKQLMAKSMSKGLAQRCVTEKVLAYL